MMVAFMLVIVAISLGVGFLAPNVFEADWMPLVLGPITVRVLGILCHWCVQLLFKGYGDPKLMREEAGEDAPEIKSLGSWSRLSEAMTVYGGEIDEPAWRC